MVDGRGGRRMAQAVRILLRCAVFALLLLPAAEAGARATQALPWWNTGWAHRQQLTVTVGANAPMGGYAGYTARFVVDTAALVTGGQLLASGDDLRIVFWTGTLWIEIPRHLIDPNTATTDIRFALMVDIA